MGLLNKLFGGNKGKNEPDPGAVNLANEFTSAFNNYVMNWRHYADLEMKYYLRKKKVYS